MKEGREKLRKNFAFKCVKSINPRVRNIIQIKKTKNFMKFINIEKYEVNFAHTGRLKKSSIPYMQRIQRIYSMKNIKLRERICAQKKIEL